MSAIEHKPICTCCSNVIRKNLRTLNTSIYNIEKNETKKLIAFPGEILCYGCAITKYRSWLTDHNIKITDKRFKKEFWIEQYPEHSDFIETRSSGKGSLQHYLNTDRTAERYINKNSKLSIGSEVLRKNGKTDEEIKLIRKNHANNSRITEETFIEKYGLIDGTKKWNRRVDRARKTSKRSLQYWLELYPKEQAIILLREHQARDKDWFAKKFGQEEGERRHSECLTKKLSKFTGVSQAQLIFEQTLLQELGGVEDVKVHADNYFISLNKEERSLLKQECIFPDLLFTSKKLVVEFFGDFWHCHPDLFLDETQIHSVINKTVKEIRRVDKLKIDILEKRGYTHLVVWEADWNSSPQLQIAKIKNLLSTL